MGNFELDLVKTLYLFCKFVSVVSTYLLTALLSYVWWMVCRWMAWSGLLVLVLVFNCVGKFSLPEGGLIILFLEL